MDNNPDGLNLEKAPKVEYSVPEENDFEEAFSEGDFGDSDNPEVNDKGDEADDYEKVKKKILSILEDLAQKIGVASTINIIENFDASGKEDPIKALREYAGIDNNKEDEEMQDENDALVSKGEGSSRDIVEDPTVKGAGGVDAINKMKELILEVKNADKKYNDLRIEAREEGVDIFEYVKRKVSEEDGRWSLSRIFDYLRDYSGEEEEEGGER